MPTDRRRRAARRRAAWVALACAAAVPLGAAGETAVVPTSPLRAVDARSAALLMSGQRGGELDLRLLVVGSAPLQPDGPGALDVVIDVGASGLAPGAAQAAVPIAFYGYALDPEGRVLGILKQATELDAVALAAPGRAGVKLLARLELPPGDYRLRALAVRGDSGSFGLVDGAASVPAAGVEPPAVLVFEPAERWLVARAPDAVDWTAGSGWVPAAQAALPRTSSARLRLALRGAEPAAGWRVGLGGDAEREVELTAGAPIESGRVGWRAWEARTDASALRAGDYRLELVGPGAERPAASVPLAVGAGGAGAQPESGQLWPDLAGAPTETEEVAAEAAPAPELPAEAITGYGLEGGYLEAIGQLAADDEVGALDTLLAAESAALRGDVGERYGRLIDVQLQVVGDLAQIDPESLPPLIRLHEIAYSTYLRRGMPPLATRSRRLAGRLALAYGERGKSADSRVVAARALESLAERVLNGGGFLEAARLFADAIELDPQSPASLRGLALLLEFSGQYVEALGYLRRAAANEPDDPELRVRLAVHRLRTGDLVGAERDLRAGLDTGPEWTRSLSAQELARVLVARGARDEAIALLRAELARRPEPAVRIQLAALLDAADRRREATELLAALESAELADRDSPRRRYDRLRDFPELERSVREFAEAARQRLPALAAANARLERKLRRR